MSLFSWLFPSNQQRQAQRVARLVLDELTILKLTARTQKGQLQRVQWLEPLVLAAGELWLPIDLGKRPLGITTNDLRHDSVLQSLHDRLNKPVRVDTLPTGKLCYVIRLGGSDFPSVFPYASFKLPDDAPPLAIPLGVDSDSVHMWVNLVNLPHLLIIGATGNGKSNFIHSLLSTWISRNDPTTLQLWLADHKGGAELDRYRKALGSKKTRPGIVTRFSSSPRDTIGLLESAFSELERRLELMRQVDASDLDEYMNQTGQSLPRIVVLIDEIFFLMLNKEKIDSSLGAGTKGFTVSQWAENLLGRIASAGRAPGVHIVIATQKTGKDVLTSLITANFEARLVFSVATMHQSIPILGTMDAVGLPKGRAVFRSADGEMHVLQTPRITPEQTRLLLNRVSRYGPDGGLGNKDESARFLNDASILLIASCEHLGGSFARERLLRLDSVRNVVTKERLEHVAKVLERDGILEPGGPRKPRRVAKAFMNKPELLASYYGPQADELPQAEPKKPQAVKPEQPPTPSDQSYGLQHPNAIKPTVEPATDTAYGLADPPQVDPAESVDPDYPMPEGFKNALRDIEKGDKNN